MAGRDPATQPASVGEPNYVSTESQRVIRRADARLLGGRLKGGHGDFFAISPGDFNL
jgi:hypothetical protein